MQNIYDDLVFFEGYSCLNCLIYGFDGVFEWFVLCVLLFDLYGCYVFDFGCGYGWFSCWVVDQGVVGVFGIDVFECMFECVILIIVYLVIMYCCVDFEMFVLLDVVFDFVYSLFVFYYVVYFDMLLYMIYCVFVLGGWFVFLIEYLIYMVLCWLGFVVDVQGNCLWLFDGYQCEGECVIDWFVLGVVKQYCMFGMFVNLLICSGFMFMYFDEWVLMFGQVDVLFVFDEECDWLMMVIVVVWWQCGCGGLLFLQIEIIVLFGLCIDMVFI